MLKVNDIMNTLQTSKLSFEDACYQVKTMGRGMRLPKWSEEVVIRCWKPTDGIGDPKAMTHPFLYVESRFGRVPWNPTVPETFSQEWEPVK